MNNNQHLSCDHTSYSHVIRSNHSLHATHDSACDEYENCWTNHCANVIFKGLGSQIIRHDDEDDVPDEVANVKEVKEHVEDHCCEIAPCLRTVPPVNFRISNQKDSCYEIHGSLKHPNDQ